MTKKKIAWITDSTAFITEDLKNNPDVYVVPLGIVFGNDVYEDGVNLTTEVLYERIRSEKEVPKTSQPPVGKFAELYEQLKAEYECAIAIHISSQLSGTMDSSKSGSDIAGFDVEVIDSKIMSYGITTLLYKGMELAKKGQSQKEIASALRTEANKSENFILLGNLEQFYKGGRMSGTQYLLGNILQIKPIIRINQEGAFELFERVRSEKKAVKRLVELLKQSYDNHTIHEIQIMHGNVLDKARKLEEQIKEIYPELNIVIGEISSTIAAHAGEGTVAIIWHNE
ncbi:DegV family protein [Anaerobacillus sp. MEB173]|uniref:DegV family protein n=1 Tax=Anaerobacillus sp. MEB173 TaxID=3383345 RepID=UPI003F8F19F5